jgi:hypothetical protein
MQEIIALFTPKTIVCNDNQFLPAGSVTCSNCPNGYTCSGGSLIFDEKKSSGIDYTQKITKSANNVCSNNFPKMLYANFKIAERNCNPGYYLPANIDECRKCLNDHYCPGGNLTFNETTDQGITHCPEQYQISPAGSYSAQQCYKPIINLDWYNGENTVAQTTCEYGSVIQLPPTPIKPGYTFVGWRLKTTPDE